MKTYFYYLFLLIPLANSSNYISIKPKTKTDRLLIINSFDPNTKSWRNKKIELFNDLSIRVKQVLSEEITRRGYNEAEVVTELINNPDNQDSIYYKLINEKQATGAIIIKEIKVWFEQTGVDVEKEGNSKSRTAHYDICSDIVYALYTLSSKENESSLNRCEYFTERNVISGFLAGGPDIVGKSKHAFRMVEKNATEYARDLKIN